MAAPLRVDLITLFPSLFDSFLAESMVERAITRGFLAVHRWDIRDWSEGKHRQVDDRPFGGGPGMVLMAPPVVAAVEAVQAVSGEPPGRLLLMSPAGRLFDQPFAAELAREPRLVLLCGRYEGFDHRIVEVLRPEPVSIGPYVLSGGEVPAMAIIEAVMRLRPGVLGDAASAVDESYGPDGGLEYPHYTRPREYRGHSVPEVLLNGDHEAVAAWRRRNRAAVPSRTIPEPS